MAEQASTLDHNRPEQIDRQNQKLNPCCFQMYINVNQTVF